MIPFSQHRPPLLSTQPDRRAHRVPYRHKEHSVQIRYVFLPLTMALRPQQDARSNPHDE